MVDPDTADLLLALRERSGPLAHVCDPCAVRYHVERDPRGPYPVDDTVVCAVCERYPRRVINGRWFRSTHRVAPSEADRAKAKLANPTTCQGKALERCQPAWRRCET